MRTLQPITPLEAVCLIDDYEAYSKITDFSEVGYEWLQWEIRRKGEVGTIVQIQCNGEDLGYYILR